MEIKVTNVKEKLRTHFPSNSMRNKIAAKLGIIDRKIITYTIKIETNERLFPDEFVKGISNVTLQRWLQQSMDNDGRWAEWVRLREPSILLVTSDSPDTVY